MSKISGESAYDHVWHSRSLMTDRAGQKLRVLIVGTLNSALVEFESGHQCVTSCFGYRRIGADAVRSPSSGRAEQEQPA